MKILFITHLSQKTTSINDIIHDSVLHGLREIYGNNVIDYPGAWYMYEEEVKKKNFDIKSLWGSGFTYYNLLSNYDQIDRTDIKSRILNNYFDIIIFGSIRRSSRFFEEATNSKSKIIFIDGEDNITIDNKILNKGVYFKRELISNEHDNVYPINCCIPKNKIIHKINTRPEHVLAPLIPHRYSTYIYSKEQDYYKMWQDSIFGLSYVHGGWWEAVRYYEMLMNGCIPLILNIDKCPEKTLTKLPKKLLFDIFNQYSWILNKYFPPFIYKKKFLTFSKFYLYFNDLFKKKHTSESFIKRYPEVIQIKEKLLEYTRANLTTEHIAKSMISDTLKYYA